MNCACCGFSIEGKSYRVEENKKVICEKCWDDPNLFFPEKIQADARLRLLSQIAANSRNQQGKVEVKVLKLAQKHIEMYSGKMKVQDILEICELDKFKEEELEGYQREQYEERTSELVQYLTKCPLAIMPALLISLRDTKFQPRDGDFGILEIPRKKGSLWIIDGQHRIGGFGKIREKFVFSKGVDPAMFLELMNYEFPVVFIDSDTAAKEIAGTMGNSKNIFTSEDIERTVFFIVNKTQKGISSSLKDVLLYRIKDSGIEGLPMIEKEGWRITGAKIGIALNCEEDSPLKEKINISGRRGTGRPIQLNSFVSSLQILLNEAEFSKLSDENKQTFLKNYWNAIKNLFPQAFDKKTQREYLLLRALGIYALNWLARDLFRECFSENCDYRKPEIFGSRLTALGSFNWNVKTSPLSGFGGVKGASRAHDLLIAELE